MTYEKKIAIIIPYFGTWPPWFEYFLHTCRYNDSIDWLIPTDNPAPNFKALNIRFIPFTLERFNETASEVLGLNTEIRHPYKICDFKPAYGLIFYELIKEYDFWGYGDMDLIYGNIRGFFPDSELEEFDLFSNHPDLVTGHFCLLRNSQEIINLFMSGEEYKNAFTNPYYTGFDERIKKQFVDPDPGGLENVLKRDRKIHVFRYRLISTIKSLIAYNRAQRWRSRSTGMGTDFTSIVDQATESGKIRYKKARTFESDLMLKKRGDRKWEIKWSEGRLENKKGEELLYYHFIVSKHQAEFRIEEFNPACKQILVSINGLRCR